MGVKECANCGEGSIEWYDVIAPPEWATYLREERDVDAGDAGVTITVCGDCYPEVDLLRQHQEWTDGLDGDAEELLAGLDLDTVSAAPDPTEPPEPPDDP